MDRKGYRGESVAGYLPLPIGAVKHRSSTAAIEAVPRQISWGKGELELGEIYVRKPMRGLGWV